MVKVKKLQWEAYPDARYADGYRPNHFCAEYYEIYEISGKGFYINNGRFSFHEKYFETMSEAMKAAQAHYEKRILWALETQ